MPVVCLRKQKVTQGYTPGVYYVHYGCIMLRRFTVSFLPFPVLLLQLTAALALLALSSKIVNIVSTLLLKDRDAYFKCQYFGLSTACRGFWVAGYPTDGTVGF